MTGNVNKIIKTQIIKGLNQSVKDRTIKKIESNNIKRKLFS
jgi:hypothetical protein